MRLDSVSAISEIAKYYGKLDDVFRLLRGLNSKTSQIWNDTWIKLSEEINRKAVKINSRDREMLVDIPCKNELIFTLFKPEPMIISTEEALENLLKLFINVKNPQMINTSFGLSLSKERDILLWITNFCDYMSITDFTFLELYNRIIEVAIQRSIKLSNIMSFVFIQEVPFLVDSLFINSIVFPWNEETNSDSMIDSWLKLMESNNIKFESVVLIWDGMIFDEFAKIYNTISNHKNIKLKIYEDTMLTDYISLLDRISHDQQSSISFNLWDEDYYFLWSKNKQGSRVNLKNWYYISNLDQNKMIQISNWVIKNKSKIFDEWANHLNIRFDHVYWIQFDCLPLKISQNWATKWSNQIYLTQANIKFNRRAIQSIENIIPFDEDINIIDSKIFKTYQSILKYNQKEGSINLQITNDSLSNKHFEWLLERLADLKDIKSISLKIGDPFSVINILNWWKQIRSISWITLQTTTNFSLVQRYHVKLITSELRALGKKVNIYASKTTLILI